jgi:hypothetical protein
MSLSLVSTGWNASGAMKGTPKEFVIQIHTFLPKSSHRPIDTHVERIKVSGLLACS